MTAEEIQTMTEGLLKAVMKDALDVELETPIKRITWNEAMDRFGSDKARHAFWDGIDKHG